MAIVVVCHHFHQNLHWMSRLSHSKKTILFHLLSLHDSLLTWMLKVRSSCTVQGTWSMLLRISLHIIMRNSAKTVAWTDPLSHLFGKNSTIIRNCPQNQSHKRLDRHKPYTYPTQCWVCWMSTLLQAHHVYMPNQQSQHKKSATYC